MPTITPLASSDVRYWWIFLLRALLFFIAGFLTFRYPIESYLTLGIIFGVTMLLTGIIEFVYVLSNRKTNGWGWRLFAAIVDLILGIILVLNIGLSMAVLPFIVGFWFLFRGITLLSFSGIIRDTGSTAWMIIGSILLIFVALLIMINPVIGALTIITWTGIGFLAAGVFNIVLAFQLKGNSLGENRAVDLDIIN
jgi:uncharacterized membrane protein HdeD (DUF308 family)